MLRLKPNISMANQNAELETMESFPDRSSVTSGFIISLILLYNV